MRDYDNEIYKTFEFLFNLDRFDIPKKNRILAALMAGEPWAWPVIGITEAALEALEQNNYKYAKGKVCRAHIRDRIATARGIFKKADGPMSQEQFFNLFKNDETVIATKSENKTGGKLPRCILFDKKGSLFRTKAIGWIHGRAESDYLRDLHARFKDGKVTLVSVPD